MIECYLIGTFSTFLTFDENKCNYAEAGVSVTYYTCDVHRSTSSLRSLPSR